MAMTYSDAELESFLSDLEADWVERKESFKGDAPTKGHLAWMFAAFRKRVLVLEPVF